MKRTQIKAIEPIKTYSKEQEDELREKMAKYCEKNKLHAISTQTIGYPFRAIYINTPDSKLLLINPVIKKLGTDYVNSSEVSEFDNDSKKVRVVKRYTRMEVETDNLGTVLFEGDKYDKTDGLNECIMAQQMIDLLNGITIRDKNINQPIVKNVKYDRNQLILARSPKGMIEQIKYKHIESLIDKGYTIL
jgi:peptide deformylase